MIRLFLAAAISAISFSAGAQTPAMIYDLNPLKGSSDPAFLTSFKGKLYFTADDGNVGRELWSYDGTGVPKLVADLAPGVRSGVLSISAPLNGKVYLSGLSGLVDTTYSYDGLSAPAFAFDSIRSSIVYYGSVTFSNRIFFFGSTISSGGGLFSYDGLNPPVRYNINAAGNFNPQSFIVYNGRLYFSADNGVNGTELFTFDTLTNTCRLAADINPGPQGSDCNSFLVAGGKLYFIAYTADYGYELYAYDGTSAVRVTDLYPGSGNGVFTRQQMAFYKGMVCFSGATSSIYRPFGYDIASGIARPITADSGNSIGTAYYSFNGLLYYRGAINAPFDTTGDELWKYDGVNSGLVADIAPGRRNSRVSGFYEHMNHLYFVASDTSHGQELYRIGATTGIQNTGFEGNLKVFPNPAADALTFELDLPQSDRISMLIYDMTGKSLLRSEYASYPSGRSRRNLSVQQLPPGQYIYHIVGGNGYTLATGLFTKQ